MAEPMDEVERQVVRAKDQMATVREMVDAVPPEAPEEVDGGEVRAAVYSALLEMDLALANATWTLQDHLAVASEAADEAWDELVKDLNEAGQRVKLWRTEVSSGGLGEALREGLQEIEDSLDGLLDRIAGRKGEGD